MKRPDHKRNRIVTSFRVAVHSVAAVFCMFGVGVLFTLAMIVVFGAVVFGAGCAFTQKVVDRTLHKTPTMKIEDLDRDRDLQDITGLASGEGGGGGGGGC